MSKVITKTERARIWRHYNMPYSDPVREAEYGKNAVMRLLSAISTLEVQLAQSESARKKCRALGGGGMSEELKPCAYCRADKPILSSWDQPNNFYCYVVCSDCGAKVAGGTKADAIAKWNTRPIEDALQAKVDALVELVSEQDKRFAHLVSEHRIAGSHLRSVSDARGKCQALGVDV